MGFLTPLKRQVELRLGWRTKDKIVCFDSDDWGSIRMPSARTFSTLCELDPSTKDNPFLANDCLESAADVESLRKTLMSYKDSKGNHPIFTLYYVPFNPDFSAIRQNGLAYVAEPTEATQARYYGDAKAIDAVREGRTQGVFDVQFHSPEHLNAIRWLRDIKNGKADAVMAFEHQTLDVGSTFCPAQRFGYMDAYNRDSDEELPWIKSRILEGVKHFESLFGSKPKGVACPCFTWDKAVEEILYQAGFAFISTDHWQYDFHKGAGTNGRRRLRLLGSRASAPMRYLTRNCNFESAEHDDALSYVEETLSQIEQCFRHGKPAIINTHRMNYVSGINPERGRIGIDALSLLFDRILSRWPEVEFCSAAALLERMEKQR